MRALLALEDGRIFEGESFGATGTRVGEVCFNTSMTGYQEVLTDPSYRGQIVAMTYPLIGNYTLSRRSSARYRKGREIRLNGICGVIFLKTRVERFRFGFFMVVLAPLSSERDYSMNRSSTGSHNRANRCD